MVLGTMKDPRKYGEKVEELDQADYKPWLMSKFLPVGASFTVDRLHKERKVVVWSRFPTLVKQAIRRAGEVKETR